jgi:hypothetical protein
MEETAKTGWMDARVEMALTARKVWMVALVVMAKMDLQDLQDKTV